MNKNDFTIKETTLNVGDGHSLFVQEWGNPKAKMPIIFLHGGPGDYFRDDHKSVFDPKVHRVIFFDQRGCGRSTPYGAIENNTTGDLVADISKIADEFNIEKFVIHGKSWGSALALAYSLAHPERVHTLVVGGIFTGSKAEADWLDKGQLKTFFPDVWQSFLDNTPAKYHKSPVKYHIDKILNGTPKEQKISAYIYNCLEMGIMKLDDRQRLMNFEEYDPAGTILEAHYMANNCFLADRYILNNAHKLNMPVHIVQGRYDMVCPPQTAHELHSQLSNSYLYWTLSGHGTGHEGENIFRSIFNSIC